MQSPFIVNDTPLALYRYPLSQNNRSLQAWDAADEYLINYVSDENLVQADSRIMIFNDSFGALACQFTQHQTTVISDSFLAHQGIQENLAQNNLEAPKLTLLDSMAELPQQADIILYKIPKK